MKRKLRLIVVSLLAVTMMAALLTGCKFVFNDLTAISLVGQPKTQYYVGDEFDTTGFKVNLHYGDTVKTVEYKNTMCEFENDFSSATVGNYKCTISVKGDNSLKFSFDYSVLDPDSKFAEGDGSVNSPYVVTTAGQFKYIGSEVGKYYKLGNDIDLTTTTTIKREGWANCYNVYTNKFVLDGANYKVKMGGKTSVFMFYNIKNSTLKNFELNLEAGSNENSIALYVTGDEVTYENITTNGAMVAQANDGMFAIFTRAKKVLLKNCVNNVNITSTDTYYAAFLGSVDNKIDSVTFDTCTNNGSMDGTTVWMLIGNQAHNVSAITINNCVNNGKLTGAGVGLVNCFASDAKKAYTTVADYSGSSVKNITITKEIDASKFVSISGKNIVNNKDMTLVNDNGTVKFADEVKTKLDAEFGEGNYSVKAFVRDWVNYGIEKNTIYMFSKEFGLDDCAIPYVALEVGDGASDTVSGAITIVDGKLKIVKTYQDKPVSLKGTTNNQVYCYYIYDANGVMKYCGQIKYANMQNKA